MRTRPQSPHCSKTRAGARYKVATRSRARSSTPIRKPNCNVKHNLPNAAIRRARKIKPTRQMNVERGCAQVRRREMLPGWTPAIRKQLEASRSTVPRYLFRCFHAGSAGGAEGLNGPAGIVPHAFLNGSAKLSIYDYPKTEIRDIIDGHLHWKHVNTPFSSWAASLRTAVNFIQCGSQPYHIAIVDLHKLNDISVYHVPRLHAAGLVPGRIIYAHENMAFGRIEGEGFASMPLSGAMISAATRILGPRTRISVSTPTEMQYAENAVNATTIADRIRALHRFTEPLGEGFSFAFTIALLTYCGDFVCEGTCNHIALRELLTGLDFKDGFDDERILTLWRRMHMHKCQHLNDGLVEQILVGMHGLPVPHAFSTDATVLSDIVYTQGYPDVKQMVRVLRALAQYRWGRYGRRRGIQPSEQCEVADKFDSSSWSVCRSAG